jgi:hypothetical protein
MHLAHLSFFGFSLLIPNFMVFIFCAGSDFGNVCRLTNRLLLLLAGVCNCNSLHYRSLVTGIPPRISSPNADLLSLEAFLSSSPTGTTISLLPLRWTPLRL